MIEFLEREHLYLVDGVITPSVSEILKFIFPEKYKGVPTNILNAKADYGSVVHEAIEKIENDEELPKLDYIQEASIKQYFKLKEKYNIAVLEQEKMVNYQGRYAGRFDMIASINGLTSLCDIKTTATLDKEYLSWQLSFYELATGKRFEKLYAIWLPKKELGKLVEIKRKSKEELLKKLEEFEVQK